VPGVQFVESVEPSVKNPELLYCIGRLYPEQHVFFTFNLSSNAVERTSILASEAMPPYAPMRFTINSEETTAYFGARALDIQGKGIGNFNVFDLNSFQLVCSTPIERGVADFAINEKTGKIYIIGFWPTEHRAYVTEWDMSSNSVTREIFVSPSGDQRAIVIDPVDPNYFYMTEGDYNLLRKVHIPTGKEVQILKFNKQDLAPYALIRGDGGVGYITCAQTRDIFKLNLSSGQLLGHITGGVMGYYQGKLYAQGGNQIWSINPSDGSRIETFNLGREIGINRLVFFNDRMVAIDYGVNGTNIPKQLLLFDARNMTILKSIDLPPEPTGNRVIASPDGSKLYLARGYMVGPSVITIFNSSTLDVINTIEVPPEIGGNCGFACCDFDEERRIAYFGGIEQIYEIHMDTNELVGYIDCWDVYEVGKARWAISSPAGVFLSSGKDKLFVISNDAHSMATYDLSNSCWMTKITNLRGYFQSDADCSPDRKYIYTVNSVSDSITMVDLTSGEVVNVIVLRVPTTVSISLSPMTTSIENAVTIEGAIVSRNPTTGNVSNAMVSICYRPVEDEVWRQLANTTTGSSGNYSYKWVTTQAGDFEVKACWAGNERYEGAESNTIAVHVRKTMTELSCFVSKDIITEGNSIVVSGSIKATLTGKTITLTYKKPNGSTLNRTATTGSDGSYSDSYTPDATGSWSVTASWDGDSAHSGTTSSSKSFIVVTTQPSTITSTAASEQTAPPPSTTVTQVIATTETTALAATTVETTTVSGPGLASYALSMIAIVGLAALIIAILVRRTIAHRS